MYKVEVRKDKKLLAFLNLKSYGTALEYRKLFLTTPIDSGINVRIINNGELK